MLIPCTYLTNRWHFSKVYTLIDHKMTSENVKMSVKTLIHKKNSQFAKYVEAGWSWNSVSLLTIQKPDSLNGFNLTHAQTFGRG